MITEIIIALISLAGIIITALVTKNSMSHELDKRITITEVKLAQYNDDVKEIVTAMPLVREQINNLNIRVRDLERGRAS